MKVLVLFFSMVFGLCSFSKAASPTVSNIISSQREGTKLVDIYYDSYDQHGDNVDISVVVKVDGTPIPTENFHGDIGMNLRPGVDQHIIWDAGSDWDLEVSSQVIFEVTVDDGMGDGPPGGMVFIPGGTNTDWVQSFYMDQTEVTKAQWDDVREWAMTNGYSFGDAVGKAPNHPVHSIHHGEVRMWCNARSEMEGRRPMYYSSSRVYGTSRTALASINPNALGFMLPNTTRRRYAAKGGVQGAVFPTGAVISHEMANYRANPDVADEVGTTSGYHPTYDVNGLPYTSPVGSFAPNGYGLYDMAGNIGEWTANSYGSYKFVEMGGSWSDSSGVLKCIYEANEVTAGANTVGFRTITY